MSSKNRAVGKYELGQAHLSQVDAALEAQRAARSLEQRATEDAFAHDERARLSHLKERIAQLGVKVKDDLDWPTLMAAWHKAGLPLNYFARGRFHFLAEAIEVRLDMLRRLRGKAGDPTPEEAVFVKRLAGRLGGHPPTEDIPIRGDKLRKLRGGLSQFRFARKIGISRGTYQKAEHRCLATPLTLEKITGIGIISLGELCK